MTTSQKRAELLNDMCDLGKMCLKDGDIDQALHWLNLAALNRILRCLSK